MDSGDPQRALELAGVGTFTWDSDGGVTCDARCLEHLASSHVARIDALLDALTPSDRDRAATALVHVVETRDAATIDLRTRDERTLRAHLSANDRGGFGALVDVTAEADAKARLVAQQELIAIVGHDLRSPLQVVTTAASILPEFGELSAPQLKTTNRIRASVEQATQLVQDLVDFAQTTVDGALSVDRTRLDLAALVRQVVDDTKAVQGTYEVAVAADGDLVGRWDRERVTQMIANLLLHAYAFAPDGGAIQVKASPFGADRVELAVSFGGDALPEEALARVFEPFESRRRAPSKPVAKSLGLGLYFARVVARAHGGDATVRSSEAGGTTMRVELPRDVAPAKS